MASKSNSVVKTDVNKFTDRRRGGRVRCDLTTCQFGAVVNISRTGMRVVSRKMVPAMPPGSSMPVKVTAAGRTLQVPARAVHNRPRADGMFEVGFQFVGITEAVARDLVDLARTAFDGSCIYHQRRAG